MLCNECGLYFQLAEHHKNLVHLNKKEIRCTFCARLFDNIDTMFDHILEHDGSTFCHVCDTSFDNYEVLFDHIDVHSSLHVYGCAKCQWTTGNVIKYLDHICARNDYSSGHDSGVESTSVTEVTNVNSIPLISSEPKHKETLNFIAKCKDSNGYYKCPLCSKQLVTLRGIRQHLFRHYDLFKFICGVCQKKFPTHSKLKEHEVIHDSTEYKCPNCNKCFASKYTLNFHSIVHNGGYVCANCGNKFYTKHRLKHHLKIRKCCGKILGCLRVYQKHILQEKHEFICKHCDRSFRTDVDLKYHSSRFHKDILNTCKCCICQTLCQGSYNFKRHLRRKHNIKISFVNFNDYNSLKNK